MTPMPKNLVTALLTDCRAGALPKRLAPSFSGWHLVGCSFLNGLSLFANTFRSVFWAASLTLTFLEWRKNRASRPRDLPFELPHDAEDGGDEVSTYEVVPSLRQDADDEIRSPFSDAYRYSGASSTAIGSQGDYSSPKYNIPSAPQPRPSLDAYGAFSDPPPTGFGAPPGDSGVSGMSRTMQYADPYSAVRASIASVPRTSPPSYQ
jgi:hypothetical protein